MSTWQQLPLLSALYFRFWNKLMATDEMPGMPESEVTGGVAASAPVLRIERARCALAGKSVLRGVDLQVFPGELVTLLGPNGAGKTTLLRAASGRVQLASGTVLVAGRNPLSDKVARRALGIVPQTIALYPQLSVRDNLSVFARLLGLRGKLQAAAVDLGLRRAGLEARGASAVAELSGGMQRRLNIVAGALHAPRLLLLDEPTVGVDVDAREAIHALLDQLRGDGMGLLLTTHDLEQAAQLADRVVLLRAGEVVAAGSVTELVDRVFAEAQELTIALRQPAEPAARAVLEHWGLRELRGGRLWSGALHGGVELLAERRAQLVAAGAEPIELRLREASLSSAYLQLTGQEFVA